MAKKATDIFIQFGYLSVTQSAADTLTFSDGLNVGIGLFQNGAIVIHKVDWEISPTTYTALSADADRIVCALCGDNKLTDLDMDNTSIYDKVGISRKEDTAIGYKIVNLNFHHDYSTLPGGGLIIPADRLYLAVYSSGTGIANVVRTRIYFTLRTLSAADYLELAQSLRVFK